MDITFEASRKVRFLSFPMSAGKAEIWLMSHQSSSKDAKEPTTAAYKAKTQNNEETTDNVRREL